MGQIGDLGQQFQRDFVVDGVPASGANEPDKAVGRAVFAVIDDKVEAQAEAVAVVGDQVQGFTEQVEAMAGAAAFGGAVSKETKAALDADLAYPADRLAVVWNDPDLTKRGVYAKVGASGSGSWSLTTLAPDSNLRPDLNAEVLFRSQRLVADLPMLTRAALLDADGLAAWTVDANGVFRAQGLSASTINGRPALSSGVFDAAVNGFVCYGQSWEVGETMSADGAAISISQSYGALMFNGGVRPRDAGGTVASQHTSLVPLVESTSGNKGESPSAGWAQMAAELVQVEDRITWDRTGFNWLGSSAAVSNTRLDQLADGTAPFQNLKDDIAYGYSLSQALGRSYVFRAFSWMQSVSDYSAGTAAATWKAGVTALRTAVNTYAKSVTGQAEDVLCVMAQPGWAGNYEATDYPWADLAMLELSESDPNFVLACPAYFLPKSSDTPHYNAQGNKIRGAYYGLAMKRKVVDRQAFAPLKPLSIRRQGKLLTVRFNPVGALKIDTMAFASVASAGFSLVTAGGAAIAIDRVDVTGRDTVTITAATAPAAGAKLRYGFAAAGVGGGNLRDSQGDLIVFDPGGLNHPMHNWCALFEKVLS
ncbi:hypothetical protein D3C72_318030 [compost metagenome]